MADNIKISEGSGPNVATDEITIDGGSAHVQRVKPVVGAAGSGADVSSSNPMPVSNTAIGAATDAEATGNGGVIGLLKRLRTRLGGGLPAELTGGGNLKVKVEEASLSAPLPVRISDGSEGLGVTSKRLHVDDGGSSLSVDDNGSTLSVDDGGNSLTVDGSVSVSGEPSVKVNSALPAGNNNIGDVDIANEPTVKLGEGTQAVGNFGLIGRANVGLLVQKNPDVDETEDAIKENAGTVYWYHYANRTAEELFLKFFNATPANVTVGSTAPYFIIPMARESQGHVAIPQGLGFGTAITVACVKGIADSSNTGPADNGCVITVAYT